MTDLSEYEQIKAGYVVNGHANGATDDTPLTTIDPTTLDGVPVPDRPWLVPNWIPMARATAFYGAGGEGKTLLAQMLATACAIGGQWLGLPTQRCPSLLLFCEDDLEEMHRRQDDINRAYGCRFTDIGAMRWLPRLGKDNALMTFDDRPRHTLLFDRLLAAAGEHHARLIITDTLADIFTGNENDRGQARAFAQQVLGLLARKIQGAVVALAHPSRAGMNSGSGESGSTAWIGTFRSQLYLSTPKNGDNEPLDPDARILTKRKVNAARRNEQIELRWQDGVFAVPAKPTSPIASIEQRTCERVFLDLLTQMMNEGQYVSHKSRGSRYAPRLFMLRTTRGRFGMRDFERAMQALFSDCKIRISQRKGADRKDYEIITPVPEGPDDGAGGSS